MKPAWTIRGKLGAGLTVVLGVISLFMFAYFPGRIEEQAVTAMRDKAVSVARLTAYTASAALYFTDDAGVHEAIAALEQVPELSYVSVLDANGVVAASRGAAPKASRLDSETVWESDGALHVRAPAVHQGEIVGQVLIGLSLAGVEAAVQESRASIAAVSLAVFAVGLLGVWLVGSIITGPLASLVAATERISAGELSGRVRITSRDELGELGAIFNSMVERLQEARRGLEESNRELENRVRDRTDELHRENEVRRRAEAKALATQARFHTVFQSSPMGIVLFDDEQRILAANPAAVEMLPVAADDRPGRRIQEVFEAANGELGQCMRDLVAGRRTSFETEARARTTGGVSGWRRVAASAVRRDDHFDLGILMIEDVTERRSLEEKLVHAQKLEAVGRLAGGVAHDFNNLLTTILGMADEARRNAGENEAVAADLDEIMKAGRRAAELTQQLLAFGRRQQLQVRVILPNETVQDTTRLLRRLIGEDIVLKLELGDVPPVKADPGQLGQVLMNLATNARDAMPRGGELTIATDRVEIDEGGAARLGTDRGGTHLRLRVRDTGHGMDDATRRLVFEPFFTTKPVGKGTGLGLATVYGIVRQSGGSISVESEPGKGTLFTILLPAVEKPVTIESAPATPEPARGGSERVLLVEDEHAVRQFLGRVLRRAGYEVLEATNGREALEIGAAADPPIDGVVTDVIMPEMGGIEMVKQMAESCGSLGVVFVSGYTRNEVLSDDGPMPPQQRFLAKPMAPAELIAAMRAVLDERAVRAA